MEDLESNNDENNPDVTDNRQARFPIPRPGSMMLMTITEEDYVQEYWPKLQEAIRQLLTTNLGDFIPISYEQMYSCVYKCVCKQFSERLYHDLEMLIVDHLTWESMRLLNTVQQPKMFIEKFNEITNQYLQALSGIVPIFNYMNRFYVESKLRTDLGLELKKLFIGHVADRHISNLITFLVDVLNKPFTVHPQVMSQLIENLYKLKPEYADLRPHLFARYIPNVLPPTQADELERYIEETQQMQRDLRTHPLFMSGDQSRKRPGDDGTGKDPPIAVNYFPESEDSQ